MSDIPEGSTMAHLRQLGALGGPPEPVPERVPDPYYRSTVFVMLDDQVEQARISAERGWEWEGPEPPRKLWLARCQGERAVLGEFASTDRDEAIAWARQRPNVKTIYVYSEEDRDIHPLDEP